jgi:hypothetical protein
MAIPNSATLVVLVAKRIRIGKYRAFGKVLETWRGDRDIETVVRLVQQQGISFDGATLRGWEYGWTGSPDPLRLQALAKVYQRSTDDAIAALAAARGVTIRGRSIDIKRHFAGRFQGASGSIEDLHAGADSAQGWPHREQRQAPANPRVLTDAGLDDEVVRAAVLVLDTLVAQQRKLGSVPSRPRSTRRGAGKGARSRRA